MGDTKDTITVRGTEVEVDRDAMESWEVFEALAALDSEDVNNFGKVQAAFDIAHSVCGLTKDEIVERCGGPKTKATDVIGYVAEIIKAAAPKN